MTDSSSPHIALRDAARGQQGQRVVRMVSFHVTAIHDRSPCVTLVSITRRSDATTIDWCRSLAGRRDDVSEDRLLQVSLVRLNWSPERLAREINRVVGSGTISAKAPYGWLRGSCPRGDLPHVVAEILSRHLQIHVSADQLWPDQVIRRCLDVPADTGLTQAWTQDGTRSSAAAMGSRNTRSDLLTLQPVSPDALNTYAMDWLINVEETLQPRTEGEPITPEMLDALQVRVADLRRMDDTRGGTVVLDWAAHDLQWASELVRRGAYDHEIGVRLHSILAELAQLTGWLACDANRHAEAHRYWLLGLHAAQTAGDTQLGANIVSCLSYQAVWTRRGGDALSLIKVARRAVRDVRSGALQALLATRQARAQAVLQDPSGCERALEEAAAHILGADPDLDPTWSYWVTPAVLAADAGRAWLDLGQPKRAETSLTQGLNLFGDTQPRNRMLHQSSLAEARLRQGELHGAAEAAHAALDLAATLNSRRGLDRLHALQAAFSRETIVVAREVADRIRSVMSHD
jgi:hypothetical protein